MKGMHVLLTVSALLAGGCGNEQWATPERLENGLVIILPGIEGEGANSYGIREGLSRGGCESALVIYGWGWPVPGIGLILNQTDVIGNRVAGQRVAQMVAKYQDGHPGRPVYVVGHSGGGGVAVFAAESLDEKHHVDGLILLSASLSSGYKLDKALARCRNGILNYYSDRDTMLLGLGTIVVGNVDGVHGASAGAAGFSRSFPKLYQRGWTRKMERTGNYGGHMDSAGAQFVAEYIAPWVTARFWPPR